MCILPEVILRYVVCVGVGGGMVISQAPVISYRIGKMDGTRTMSVSYMLNIQRTRSLSADVQQIFCSISRPNNDG